jgi:hypothetical protein
MNKKSNIFLSLAVLLLSLLLIGSSSVMAQPYGQGTYDANVPYGGETSLSIATNGNVTIPVTPTSAGVSASGTSTVTVTSTDVQGYELYVRALGSTSLTNFSSTLPASANGVPAALAMNTWGYNTDASSNFVGMLLTDTLIRSTTGPVSAGQNTTVTYGIRIDLSKAAGNYSTTVMYTAVPKTD